MSQYSSLSRRLFLKIAPAALAAAPLGVSLLSSARADTQPAPMTVNDPRLAPRIIGNPEAKILVQEWFSLTCTHCAHFATEEFPKIKEKFIDTGKIRYQFHNFPLNEIDLVAIMVSLSLPADRYLPFISSLFSRQMQWAFNSDNNPLEHLKQEAALAGISSLEFDKIMNDKSFRQALIQQAEKDTKTYKIEGTPYFRFNNVALPADPGTLEKFEEYITKASATH